MLIIQKLLSPEFLALLTAVVVAAKAVFNGALTLIGLLTIFVAALEKLIPPMQQYANETETNTDNALVGLFASCVGICAGVLDKAKHILELGAGNKWGKK